MRGRTLCGNGLECLWWNTSVCQAGKAGYSVQRLRARLLSGESFTSRGLIYAQSVSRLREPLENPSMLRESLENPANPSATLMPDAAQDRSCPGPEPKWQVARN